MVSNTIKYKKECKKERNMKNYISTSLMKSTNFDSDTLKRNISLLIFEMELFYNNNKVEIKNPFVISFFLSLKLFVQIENSYWQKVYRE